MSNKFVKQILEKRSEFIKHLKEDVCKNEVIIESTMDKLNDLKITTENVKELGRNVEHESLIPLGRRIYVNGTITHTGEYFLDRLAFPDSYSTVETLEDTIKHLESKIKQETDILHKSEAAKEQLLERINLIQGNNDNDDNIPKEIISDKGVAVKVGDFYEILEFEN